MQNSAISKADVNYDDTPITELEIDGVSYRVDTGLGSAVAVSERGVDSWDWQLVGEGRWDGSRLRLRGLGHPIREALGRSLAAAMKNRDE